MVGLAIQAYKVHMNLIHELQKIGVTSRLQPLLKENVCLPEIYLPLQFASYCVAVHSNGSTAVENLKICISIEIFTRKRLERIKLR